MSYVKKHNTEPVEVKITGLVAKKLREQHRISQQGVGESGGAVSLNNYVVEIIDCFLMNQRSGKTYLREEIPLIGSSMEGWEDEE